MEELKIRDEAKNPELKEYVLIQHTEHIHFQAHEKGACLRGTEVKPKLDKFISCFCNKNNIVLPESCYLKQSGEEITALNYSTSIYPVKVSTDGKYAKFNIPSAKQTAYFGNEGNEENVVKKESVLYPDGLILGIHCCKQQIDVHVGDCSFKSLMELIDYVLPAFFTLTCFGTRSTKGFGSYEIKEKQKRLPDDKNYLLQFVPVIYYLTFTEKNVEMLEIIKIISNMMKAGLNYSFQNKNDDPSDDFYYKGRIFRYFTKYKVGSEKAFMKQNIFQEIDTHPENEEKKQYSDFYYNRGILGLAPSYEFRKKNNITIEVNVKDGESNKICIERFNNPIHFKPNGNNLLIIPTDIPEIMGSHTFIFDFKENKGKKPDKGNKNKYSKCLTTPAVNKSKDVDPGKGEFNLEAFLDYFMNEYNSEKDMISSKHKIKKMFWKLTYKNKLVKMNKVGV